ncbi:MAG: response regulator [Thermoplasmata archaeon]|nr:response regulator [Thermoplasmata archaeon]
MSRILLVEDNVQNLKLATVILRHEGHEVIPASDAEEAERHLAANPPDLVLMDIGLPGKDGYTLTREIRRNPALAHIPVLVVTSFAMKGDERKAREAGCSGYLTKPINRVELLSEIRRLLPNASSSPRAGRPGPEDPSGRSGAGGAGK